jgi:hypothetical protein
MRSIFTGFIVVIVGCESPVLLPLTVPEPSDPPPESVKLTDSGTMTGTVHWNGPVPPAAPFSMPWKRDSLFSNPHAFAIDNGRLKNAIVSLDTSKRVEGLAWPHDPVTIVLLNDGIEIEQGGSRRRTGIVRPGDMVSIVNTTAAIAGVRGRGAATFGHVLSPAVAQVNRVLPRAGIVSLTSASGLFWAHAEVIVSDHPWHAITDAEGRFVLRNVPPGNHTLTVRHANPSVADRESDPETGLLVRQRYGPDYLQQHTIRIEPSTATSLEIHLQDTTITE